MDKNKNEILNSNDKLSKKLDRVFTEQVAITDNYQPVEGRVKNLEYYSEKVDQKLNLGFPRV